MATHSLKSLSASLVAPAALFAAGVLSADRIEHFLATRDATKPVPRVEVEYTPTGVIIDGQPYADGKLGGPRCDWDSITVSDRRDYALDAIVRDNGVIGEYLTTLPATDKERLVYRSLVHLARERGTTPGKQAEVIERSVGWRWNLVYTQRTPE